MLLNNRVSVRVSFSLADETLQQIKHSANETDNEAKDSLEGNNALLKGRINCKVRLN